jgi:hypothetical protein
VKRENKPLVRSPAKVYAYYRDRFQPIDELPRLEDDVGENLVPVLVYLVRIICLSIGRLG